jgi:hypothetical protein
MATPSEREARVDDSMTDWTARAREITKDYIMLGREELSQSIAALAAEAFQAGRERCDFCGALDWTVATYGRLVHKHACPARERCQTHPDGCYQAGHAAGVAEMRARVMDFIDWWHKATGKPPDWTPSGKAFDDQTRCLEQLAFYLADGPNGTRDYIQATIDCRKAAALRAGRGE